MNSTAEFPALWDLAIPIISLGLALLLYFKIDWVFDVILKFKNRGKK